MRWAFWPVLLLAPAAPTVKTPPPAVVILCATGAIHRGEGAVASGGNCVLHDKNGATTAEALVVYDAGEALP